MKKVLIVASVASMIQQFNMENIKILLQKKCEVSVATNFLCPGTITTEDADKLKSELQLLGVKCVQVDFPRGVGNIKQNRLVIKQLRQLAKNNYNLLHVHSPIGGALTRISFSSRKTKLLYTAHGFQFYKGSSIKDWLIFFPIEFILSFNTTAILTINNEDTQLAENFLYSEIYKIPGVGINYDEIQQQLLNKKDSNFLKQSLKLEDDSIIMVSVGELNARKNQVSVIKAMAKVNNPKLHYVLCGIGPDEKELYKVAMENNLEKNVHFMGYTHNISEILVSSDFSVFLSRREGLGLAGLESMAAGLPLISSYVNGIKDYTEDKVTGFTVQNPMDIGEIASSIEKLINLDDKILAEISTNNQKIAKHYSIKAVNSKMNVIYDKYLN